MSTPAEMAERHGRILSELSELGLGLARDLQARALAAEDTATAADLALAFHRISRSVRQSLALEARLDRDLRRHSRDDREEAEREAAARVKQRKAQLRKAVERAIWDEVEGEEAECLVYDLDDLLQLEAASEEFTLAPVAAQIARLREGLGLSAAANESEPPRRSSA